MNELRAIKEFFDGQELVDHNQYLYGTALHLLGEIGGLGEGCVGVFRKGFGDLEVSYYVRYLTGFVLPYYKNSINKIWAWFDSEENGENFFLKVRDEREKGASFVSFLDKLENWAIVMWGSDLGFLKTEINQFCERIIEDCEAYKARLVSLVNFCRLCGDLKEIDVRKLRTMESLSLNIKTFKSKIGRLDSYPAKLDLHKKISMEFSVCITTLNQELQNIQKIKTNLEDYQLLFSSFRIYHEKFLKYSQSIGTSHKDYILKASADLQKSKLAQLQTDSLKHTEDRSLPISKTSTRSRSNPLTPKSQDIFNLRPSKASHDPDPAGFTVEAINLP